MPKSIPQKCVVCGLENTHGKHFGVESCRACAVFFRRHAGTKYVYMKCQSVHCDRKNEFCKPCRLKKCYEVGMNSEKFQHNRDPLKTKIIEHRSQVIPQSFASLVGRPSLVIFCIPEENPKKTFVDLNSLLQKSSEMLQHGPETPYFGISQLQKMTMGSTLSTRLGIEIIKTISKTEMSFFWEYYLLRTTKWFTHLEEFHRIPQSIKVLLVTSSWHVFARLEKMMSTAIARRQKLINSEKMFAMSNGLALDMDSTKLDFSALSDYPMEKLLFFINSLTTWDLRPEIQKLEELNVSEMEFNFMMAQLIFTYVGKRYQGDVLEICDKILEILTNDLHKYYVNEMKMTRYAGRLSQLLKINNAIQNDIWKNRPRGELASLFNVFHVKFSHPDMFIDTGFV